MSFEPFIVNLREKFHRMFRKLVRSVFSEITRERSKNLNSGGEPTCPENAPPEDGPRNASEPLVRFGQKTNVYGISYRNKYSVVTIGFYRRAVNVPWLRY